MRWLRAGLVLLFLSGCSTLPRKPVYPRGLAAELDATPELPLTNRTGADALAQLSEGLAHDMRMEPEAATRAYRAALALEPDNRDLTRFVFLQLAKTRRFDDALEIARAAQTRWPTEAQPWLWEAQAQATLRRNTPARESLAEAIRREPGVVGPHLDLARLLLQDQRTTDAEAALKEAIRLVPDSPLPARFLSELHPMREAELVELPERRAYQEKALADLDAALARFPADFVLLAQSARLLIALDRFDDAIPRFHRMEDTKPDDLETKVQLAGLMLRACGGRAEALAQLKRYNGSHARDARALLYEGLLLETGPDATRALELYRAALAGDPVEVTAFQKLAASLIETNDLASAQAVLSQGLEKFPAHNKLREWRAFLLMGEEKYEEAHALFRELEPIRRRELDAITDPRQRERETKRLAAFHLQYALAAQSVGDLDHAARLLADGIRAEPAQIQLFTRHVGKIDTKGERLPDAVRTLEAAGRLLPGEPLLFIQLGVVANTAKRHEEAVAAFRRAERLADARGSRDKDLGAYFLFHYGSALERNGQLEEAAETFRACIRAAPAFVEARNYMAFMWAENAIHLDEAMTHIELALKVDPDNAAYLDTRGWIRFQQGDLAGAVRDIRRSIQLHDDKHDPELQRHLGDALWMAGHLEAARAAWQTAADKHPDDEPLRLRLAWPLPAEGEPSELLPPAPLN